jgi:hypothetical protein
VIIMPPVDNLSVGDYPPATMPQSRNTVVNSAVFNLCGLPVASTLGIHQQTVCAASVQAVHQPLLGPHYAATTFHWPLAPCRFHETLDRPNNQTISGFGSLIGATAIGFTAILVLHATPFQLGILAAVHLAPGCCFQNYLA